RLALECAIIPYQELSGNYNTAAEVVKAVDGLHRKYGRKFEQIFKTITVDNGGEFSSCEELERGGRTKIFYCHPFSSWERGSNERANRIIRRFIPKGVNIGNYSKRDVQQIQDWINNYPRKILGWKCASTLFFDELDILFNAA
ncbi:MAG: IS30 family transposase, partial [Oscillospiraceae bacterium]